VTDAVLDANKAETAIDSAGGAPRKRNAERTRKAILAAALKEFAQAGFAGARIEKIVKAAKCNIRMLYHYFGDKKGLYMAVLESAYMDLRAREAELKIDFDKPLEGFLELQRFTFDYFEKNPRFEGLLRNENLQHGKFAAQSRVVTETAFPLRRTIEKLIRSGQDQGVDLCDHRRHEPVSLGKRLLAVGDPGHRYERARVAQGAAGPRPGLARRLSDARRALGLIEPEAWPGPALWAAADR
jgi:AcrR family transcriptional regulator